MARTASKPSGCLPYDYDAVQTPVLVNAPLKGQLRKLIVTANRNGFLYILDRTNGKFLFGKSFVETQNWAMGLDENGRPISVGLIPNEKGVRVCPANGGATNWYSPSYNPATHMLYFRSYEACALIRSNAHPFVEGQAYSLCPRTGLVAFGDDAQNFVVSDGRTGKPLWHFHAGQLVHASPMSYAVDGRQYFAIAAGRDVFSFALP